MDVVKENIVSKVTFRDANEFLNKISYGGEFYKIFQSYLYVFRGQESAKYKLIPTVLREVDKNQSYKKTNLMQIEYEYDILKKFYLKCDEHGINIPDNEKLRSKEHDRFDKWLPKDLYDIAALAQHYGLPTRLLDWSYNINTAIYFAIINLLRHPEKCDGQDFITIWSTLLSHNKTDRCSMDSSKIPSLKIIRPIYKYNPNLRAQEGLFTLWENSYANSYNDSVVVESLEVSYNKYLNENKISTSGIFRCLMVPNTIYNIRCLYDYLKGNNVDTSTLFPGLKGTADFMSDEKKYNDYFI